MTTPSLAAVVDDEILYLTCTPVEINVIGYLLADGAPNDVIARRMNRSVDTVKTHLSRIFVKAGHVNRVELAIKILREDIYILDEHGRRVRF